MVILESLTDRTLVEVSPFNIIQRYAMLMDGKTPVEIVIVSVAAPDFLTALERVSKTLLPKRFYAHFVNGNVMYVVYPSTISVVEKGNKIDADNCLEIGDHFDVPAGQLPIDKMFSFGHAEHD